MKTKRKLHYLTMLNIVVWVNVMGVLLALLTVFGTVYYRSNRKTIMNQIQGSIDQTESYVELYVDGIVTLAEKLSMDMELGVAVEEYRSDDMLLRVKGKKMLEYILQSALDEHAHIENIAIGTKTDLYEQDQYSLNVYTSMEGILGADWYQALQQEEVSNVLLANTYYTSSFNQDTSYLYATKFKNKYYQSRDDEERILIVTFSLDDMKQHLNSLYGGKDILIHILETETGNLLYQSTENDRISRYLSGELVESEREQIRREYEFFEKDYGQAGWEIIGCIRRNTMNDMIYQIKPWMVLTLLGVLLIAPLLNAFTSRVISKPIKQLSQAMESAENGLFCRVELPTRCIEMERLIQTYNHMAIDITRLIEDVRFREEEKRRIEYKMLEAQLNPHFIYNTLDAVKWVAHANRSEKVVNIIESFVRLLRLSLSGGSENILVRDEIALVKEYSHIMIFRNNYEVKLTYEIAPETLSCHTLKLVLQPFVENCFLHAFRTDNRDRQIHIQSRLEEDKLVFVIQDNGTGIETEKRKKRQMTGIGIDNIDRRIKVWYGDAYGVEIRSEEGVGTTVFIRQPIMREEGNDDTGYDRRG